MKPLMRSLAFCIAALTAQSASAAATFFEFENFSGRQLATEGVVPNFVERGFNDRAMSAIVEGAPVEVCIDINFNGGCTVLNPGQYPTLGDLRGRISSVRPVRGEPGYSRGEPGQDRGERRMASATLFAGPNMQGRSFTLTGRGENDLGRFNERASSLVVERGYWIFCNEPNFGGECRTFGPGNYATLPPDLDNRISSGRRISNHYPYSSAPRW